MTDDGDRLAQYVEAIRQSGLTIFDPIEIGDPELWIPTPELRALLNAELTGTCFGKVAPRTRSKIAKQHVSRILGYPVPRAFKRKKPDFPGQFLDAYVQQSKNLQVWNEPLEPTRRYAVIRVDAGNVVTKVKVVMGAVLAELDKTGTKTEKLQAQLKPGAEIMELIAAEDTARLRPLVRSGIDLGDVASPVNHPQKHQLLPIAEIFDRLAVLVGQSFPDAGHGQERNRGAELHRLVCRHLGYNKYADNGQFPDVRHQLLEVKLQTSPTIDLGRVCPDSEGVLNLLEIEGRQIRPRDVRYVLFYGEADGDTVTLTHLYLTTGETFFDRFPQLKGNVKNTKRQIPLPSDFFDD